MQDGRSAEIRANFYFPATAPLITTDSQFTGFPYAERGYLVEPHD
jgi:hypothetical protein